MAKNTVQKVEVFIGVSISKSEVEEINRLHNSNAEDYEEYVRKSLPRAVQIGEKLAAYKSQFPKRAEKGQGFEDWIEATFAFTGRMGRNYIRCFENRGQITQGMTISGFLESISKPKEKAIPETTSGMKPGTENESSAEKAVAATWTEEGSQEIALEPKDEKKAEELASFLGVDINKARAWVQNKKRQPKPKKKRDKSKLVPVTIRFTYDEVDIMEKVARKNKLPFAEVAREHHKLGTRAFVRKYGFE
jgi:hypothetical protein